MNDELSLVQQDFCKVDFLPIPNAPEHFGNLISQLLLT